MLVVGELTVIQPLVNGSESNDLHHRNSMLINEVFGDLLTLCCVKMGCRCPVRTQRDDPHLKHTMSDLSPFQHVFHSYWNLF